MTRSRSWFFAAVVVVAAVAVVGSLVAPTGRVARAARGGLAPVVASSGVCPSVAGGPAGLSTDMVVAHVTPGPVPHVTYVPVLGSGGAKRAATMTPNPIARLHKDTAYASVAVTATGAGADGVVAGQTALIPGGLGRGLTDVACTPASTDWWFAGADGRIGITDLLFLVNPSDTAANVALSFWSSRGPLSPPNTGGITVAAHSVQIHHVSDYAPDVAGVAVHVHANSGTVAAAIVDLESSGNKPLGSDWIGASTAPTSSTVVTGFMPGSTFDRLDLVNPGDSDATVSLRIATPTKNFAPAGHQTVIVQAGHTTSVDLSGAISGEAAAALVSSDVPVTAAGLTAQQPTNGLRELAWLPAQRPLVSAAGVANNVPPFAQKVNLVVTAPQAAARLRISAPGGATATVAVPAGRTVNVDLRAALHAGAGGPGPLLLSPLDAPVYVMRTMYATGAHGPLMTASAPVVLPQPVSLPPVVSDPRAALP